MKRKATGWEEIFANYIFSKAHGPNKIYKELSKLKSGNTKLQIAKQANNLTDILPTRW